MPPAKLLLIVAAVVLAYPVSAQTAQRFHLLITEIMADPTPVVGLPNAEYIEIRNVSATAWNLQGWRIGDATGVATINTTFVLQPDSMVILCANSNVAQLAAFGRTIGVTSFPSLDNDGELVILRSPQNRIIHAVQYANTWYGNAVKAEGGWSLEIIDFTNPCTGSENWIASTSTTGGTPGKMNSVAAHNPDNTPPRLRKAFTTDNRTVVLVFDESLDSSAASTAINFSLQGNSVLSALPQSPLFEQVQLQLQTPLQPQQVTTITVTKITDCRGNEIGAYNKAKVGLSQPAAPTDIVINEVLSDPRPGGYDYLEFYNRSHKIIDAATLYIANRNSSGAAASLRRLSDEPFTIFPGDFVVTTEDAASLSREYLVKNSDAVLQ
ncbi:MAG: lamin tail domain-containing protein, partial [Bacteroidota bacterium]|nr:lamin tail domain-containing protein [Bacteroidota bacterium]